MSAPAPNAEWSATRGMLAELDDLIEWLRVARGPDEIGAARGFAMALRMRLADLTRWSGHNREMVEWVKTEREAYRERARRYARCVADSSVAASRRSNMHRRRD